MKKGMTTEGSGKTDAGELSWFRLVLQGLSFWLAYKSSRYRHYEWGESAIIAELAGLLVENLPKSLLPANSQAVVFECPYARLSQELTPAVVGRKTSADIAIGELDPRKKGVRRLVNPEIVLEVKRGRYESHVRGDIVRLAKVLRASKQRSCRAFIILVVQEGRPHGKWLKKGNDQLATHKKPYQIKTKDGHGEYWPRRAARAYSSNSGKALNWCCLLEVGPGTE